MLQSDIFCCFVSSGLLVDAEKLDMWIRYGGEAEGPRGLDRLGLG